MHVLAEHMAQRRVQEVRRGVIALGVAAAVRRHRGRGEPEAHPTRGRADCGHLAVDFLHFGDVHGPVLAADLPAVGDLSARLGVEGALAQHHGYLPALELLDARHGGRDLRAIVAHEAGLGDRVLRGPGGHVVQFIGHDAELAALAVVLAHLALGVQRRLEAGDVHEVAALAGHQLREVHREAKGVVELEDVLAGDGAAHLARPLRAAERGRVPRSA